MIIFGWGRRTMHDAGPVVYQQCPRCHNTNWQYLVTVRRWFTLFFLPVIPYDSSHLLICPVCTRGLNISGEELARARKMNELAKLYVTQFITGDEYRQRLSAIPGAPPLDATLPPATSADPLAPNQAPRVTGSAADAPAQAAPTAAPATPGAATPAGASPAAAQPAPIAPAGTGGGGIPPVPQPTFRGSPPSPLRRVMRVVAPLVVIVILFIVFFVLNRGGSNSGFTAGSCVTGSPDSTSINAVDCSQNHDARIDSVLSNPQNPCPSNDLEFVPQSPDPALCLNYSDHKP